VPTTARQHFLQDIARARALVAHADLLPVTNSAEQLLRSDLLRSAWMFAVGALDAWFTHSEAKKRLFGVPTVAYQAMTPQHKELARQAAQEQLENRFAELFQRRHDCIHNCDRPKVSPQALKVSGTVLKVIQDVECFSSTAATNTSTPSSGSSCKMPVAQRRPLPPPGIREITVLSFSARVFA